MAGGAQGDQVLKLVRCFPTDEAPDGFNVVHMKRFEMTRDAANLAAISIPVNDPFSDSVPSFALVIWIRIPQHLVFNS